MFRPYNDGDWSDIVRHGLAIWKFAFGMRLLAISRRKLGAQTGHSAILKLTAMLGLIQIRIPLLACPAFRQSAEIQTAPPTPLHFPRQSPI